MSEEKIDLSAFDGIADRVARSKAKAEAIRAAKALGASPPSPIPSSPPPPPGKGSARETPQGGAPSAPADRTETKVDLSNLDAITDRVARAKAKAEAIRVARAGGAAPPAPAAPAAAPPAQPVTEPDASGEVAAADASGHKVDLSSLDAITDRVARAKAKAEAIRAARTSGVAPPAPASKSPPAEARPKKEVSAEAIAAKKAQARGATRAGAETPPAPPSLPGGNGAAFCAGMTIRRNGKLARIVTAQHENVCFVFQDSPGQRVMTKRYRLEAERRRGVLQFASPAEFSAAIPPGVGKFGRSIAFLAAAAGAGVVFLGGGLLIGPLSVFPTLLVGYVLFALAHHLTK